MRLCLDVVLDTAILDPAITRRSSHVHVAFIILTGNAFKYSCLHKPVLEQHRIKQFMIRFFSSVHLMCHTLKLKAFMFLCRHCFYICF